MVIEKKNKNWFWWAIIGGLMVVAIILGAGWCSASKKPAQINTVIKRLPPRTETDYVHDTAVVTESEIVWDTILQVDSTVIQNVAMDFCHLWPGTFGMGWIDSLGEYHYSHFDFPDTRYGLHASVERGVPHLSVYDFGKYVERERKWRVELELGGGLNLKSDASHEKSLLTSPTAGTAARLVLGEYKLRRLSFEIVPVEVGVDIPEGFTAKAKFKVIF